MLSIHKSSHLVNASGREKFYQRVEDLSLSEQELEHGKPVKAACFSRDHKVKRSRVVAATRCTGWIFTDELSNDAARGAQQRQPRTACRRTESYQCHMEHVQHSYIACVVLAWLHVRYMVCQSGQSIYQVECDLPHDYLVGQLKSPSVQMLLE